MDAVNLLIDLLSEKAARFPSQAAAARDLGVAPSLLTRWIAGREVPGIKRVPRLAEWCGVTVELMDAARRSASRTRGELPQRLARLERNVEELSRKVADLEAKSTVTAAN